MKSLEIVAWLVGVTLVTLYLGATAWGQSERQRGVEAFVTAQQSARVESAAASPDAAARAPAAQRSAMPATQATDLAVIGVLRIPVIELEVPVAQGTDETVLSRGAGLIVGSATPGSDGNVAIAAHRDTFFRGLKDITVGDLVELDTLDRPRTYRVTELLVVEPTDVHVLADTGEPVLTLVTCYPFYFVGRAPQRFIVRAVAADVAT
jgi:sortase A